MDLKDLDTLYRKYPFLGRFLWRVDKVSEKSMSNDFLDLRSVRATEIYLLDSAGTLIRRVGRCCFGIFIRNRSVAEELGLLKRGTRYRIAYAVALAQGELVLYTVPHPFKTLEGWQKGFRDAGPRKNRTSLRLVA